MFRTARRIAELEKRIEKLENATEISREVGPHGDYLSPSSYGAPLRLNEVVTRLISELGLRPRPRRYEPDIAFEKESDK